jgi:hypothetical protein
MHRKFELENMKKRNNLGYLCINGRITLTPWCQNPKVRHCIHNSPPMILILSQVNPLHTPPTNLPKVHFDPILPSTPWSFKVFFLWTFPPKLCTHSSPLPCVKDNINMDKNRTGYRGVDLTGNAPH